LDVDVVRQLVSAPNDVPRIAAVDSGRPTARSVWVYRPDGRRTYREDDKELALLRKSRNKVIIFVDGTASPPVVHRFDRKKPTKETLTATELELLRRYLISAHDGRGSLLPIELRVSQHSRDSAATAFKRLRQKADVKVGGQKYRLFKQVRSFEGGPSSYEWRPDAEFKFCVVVYSSGE
jgi:hypothetical protein